MPVVMDISSDKIGLALRGLRFGDIGSDGCAGSE